LVELKARHLRLAQALAKIAQEVSCRVEHGVDQQAVPHLQFMERLARKALKENYDGWPGTGD
jgi:hypothetical protein